MVGKGRDAVECCLLLIDLVTLRGLTDEVVE